MRTGAIVAVVFVVLVAGALFWFDPFGWRSTAVATVQTSGAPTANAANQVAEAIRQFGKDPAPESSSEIKNQVANSKIPAIPPGARLEPLVSSWAPDGASGGTMDVTLIEPGHPDQYFLVLMVQEGNAWKVRLTLRATADSPTASPK